MYEVYLISYEIQWLKLCLEVPLNDIPFLMYKIKKVTISPSRSKI